MLTVGSATDRLSALVCEAALERKRAAGEAGAGPELEAAILQTRSAIRKAFDNRQMPAAIHNARKL